MVERAGRALPLGCADFLTGARCTGESSPSESERPRNAESIIGAIAAEPQTTSEACNRQGRAGMRVLRVARARAS